MRISKIFAKATKLLLLLFVVRMKLLLVLLGLLLVTQSWAKPKDVERENEIDQEQEEEQEADEGGYAKPQNPCYDHHCSLGKQCVLDDDDEPICVCASECTPETEDRAKVCSTTNVTFESECELHRQKCLCHMDQEGCRNPEYRHQHMDYFGPCIEMTKCTEPELKDFPIRMREWLFLIMEELADRKELPRPALKLARKAKKQTKRWVLPVFWKFCDLDRTHDLFVDPHELIPITAPLKPLEHCTGPFIEKCDADNDGHIDMREWSVCLQLDDEDQKENMEELCNTLQRDD